MAILASMALITLSLTGAPEAAVSGVCVVVTANGSEEILAIDGPLPQRRELNAQGLDCRLTATGTVTVEIRKQGRVSRSSTTGGSIAISVR